MGRRLASGAGRVEPAAQRIAPAAFRLPLVLVGNARLVPAMQEIAADLWSLRSLVAH